MLCFHCIWILNNLWTRGSAFCTGPEKQKSKSTFLKVCISLCEFLKSSSPFRTQRWEWVAYRKETLQPSIRIALHPLNDEIYIDGSSGYFQASEFYFRKHDWCGCVSKHTTISLWQVSSDGQSFVLIRQRLEFQYLCGSLSFCIIHIPRLLPILATCFENVCLQSGGGAMYRGWINC